MDVSIPLSAKGIRQATRSLGRLKKALAKDDEGVQPLIRSMAAESIRGGLDENILAIPDPDGNFASTQTTRTVNALGLTYVQWLGPQIAYLEFGTGAVALDTGGYPNPAIPSSVGYEPQRLHGNIAPSEWWWYEDRTMGFKRATRGIPAYAPMYNTAMSASMYLGNDNFYARAGAEMQDTITTAFEGR